MIEWIPFDFIEYCLLAIYHAVFCTIYSAAVLPTLLSLESYVGVEYDVHWSFWVLCPGHLL